MNPSKYGNRYYENRDIFPFCSIDNFVVNCLWGNWSESWSTCTESCGDSGTRIKTRSMIQEAAKGGAYCTGDEKKQQECNRYNCPGKSYSE